MFAEKNEGGDIPAHDEHGDRCPHDGKTHGIYVSQVFRRQEKRICPESLHKTAADRAEHYKPE